MYGSAYPTEYGTATATIVFNRNPSSPVFIDQFCSSNVAEDTIIGAYVLNQTATDDDGESLNFLNNTDSVLMFHSLVAEFFCHIVRKEETAKASYF